MATAIIISGCIIASALGLKPDFVMVVVLGIVASFCATCDIIAWFK